MDPDADPGGPKTYGSGTATLVGTVENGARQNPSGKVVKHSSLHRAKQRFEEKKAAAARKQEEFQQRQKDRAEALKKYRQKKDLRFKKLSAKTRKGQPLMGGRIELLLEKIQEQMAQ
jgi:hypothetical protein